VENIEEYFYLKKYLGEMYKGTFRKTTPVYVVIEHSNIISINI